MYNNNRKGVLDVFWCNGLIQGSYIVYINLCIIIYNKFWSKVLIRSSYILYMNLYMKVNCDKIEMYAVEK